MAIIIITYLYNNKLESQGSRFMNSALCASFYLAQTEAQKHKLLFSKHDNLRKATCPFPN